MYKQYPSIYIDEGLDRIYRTWDPWVNRVTHTPPCTRRGGCLGIESPSGLGGWFDWLKPGLLVMISPAAALVNLPSQIQALFGGNAMTSRDMQAKATDLYNKGQITYQQLIEISNRTKELENIELQKSGLYQASQIMKWGVILAGLGVGVYLLAPTAKKAINLIPIPERAPVKKKK